MEEWIKVNKMLSGRVRLLEFIVAMSGTSPYRVARELERKGFVDNYRTIIIDYIRLTDKKWLLKNRGIREPLYRILKTEEEEKRPKRKIIQVNYDYIVPLFMKVCGIENEQLINKTKEAILEMVSAWKLSVKEATETYKLISKEMDFESFFSAIIIAAVMNSEKISLKEKEEVILRITNRFLTKILKNPLYLAKLLYMFNLTLQRKEDFEKISAGIAETFTKAMIEAFAILLKPLGFQKEK